MDQYANRWHESMRCFDIFVRVELSWMGAGYTMMNYMLGLCNMVNSKGDLVGYSHKYKIVILYLLYNGTFSGYNATANSLLSQNIGKLFIFRHKQLWYLRHGVFLRFNVEKYMYLLHISTSIWKYTYPKDKLTNMISVNHILQFEYPPLYCTLNRCLITTFLTMRLFFRMFCCVSWRLVICTHFVILSPISLLRWSYDRLIFILEPSCMPILSILKQDLDTNFDIEFVNKSSNNVLSICHKCLKPFFFVTRYNNGYKYSSKARIRMDGICSHKQLMITTYSSHSSWIVHLAMLTLSVLYSMRLNNSISTFTRFFDNVYHMALMKLQLWRQ